MNTKNLVHPTLFVLFILILAGCGGPVILSGYGSTIGANALPRASAHPGVDIGDLYGAPVLASADGEVAYIVQGNPIAGNCVLLAHRANVVKVAEGNLKTRYTLYCHLAEVNVKWAEAVKRGQQIGIVGNSGNTAGVPHVHWELCTWRCPYGHYDGDFRGTEDPLAITIGCFDPSAAYPTDQLVLTYPVSCKPK